MSDKIKSYKGTDSEMKCRGFQYKIGETYRHDGDIGLCDAGFHACATPLDVWSYYEPANSRFFEVEQTGTVEHGEDKTVSSELTVKAEISLPGLIKAHVDLILSKVKKSKKATNTGESSSSTNTGESSSSTNTGDRSASTNTGDSSASTNTGDRSASTNTGDRSASTNTGYRSSSTNTGDRSASTNTGYRSSSTNTGDSSASTNTGDRSASTNTGESSSSKVSGKNSVALAFGIAARAMVESDSSYLVIGDWRYVDGGWRLHKLWSARPGEKIGRTKIKTSVWYWFDGGKLNREPVKS